MGKVPTISRSASPGSCPILKSKLFRKFPPLFNVYGDMNSSKSSLNSRQAWAGTCLAHNHFNLSPANRAASTSPAQRRFAVIPCLNSAPQLWQSRYPNPRERSSLTEANEFPLQYMHRNGALTLVGATRSFRFKYSFWCDFLCGDLVSVVCLFCRGSLVPFFFPTRLESAGWAFGLLLGVAVAFLNESVVYCFWVDKNIHDPALLLTTYRILISSLSLWPPINTGLPHHCALDFVFWFVRQYFLVRFHVIRCWWWCRDTPYSGIGLVDVDELNTALRLLLDIGWDFRAW